ncbi:hypothetical protein [Leucobacter musarum]|uniref:hypothetical protein n=1 Tax=Leucobacter musarum TaxID=1930747 RepID=UPI0006A767AA|nr:hypothetical protein [Leucobacter musarum]
MIPHDDRPATPSEALQIALTHESRVSGCNLDWIRERQSPGTRSALDHALAEFAAGDLRLAQEYVRLACELSRQASQHADETAPG